MTKQELAKHIDNLKWCNIQCDCPEDGFALEFAKERLMELEKGEAIDLLFAVLEAQNLPHDFMGENRIMHEFRFL